MGECDRTRSHEETVITAIRKTLSAAAVVTVALAGVAACGTAEQLSAGQKLDRAFDKLGQEKSLSFELDLDTDSASLMALDEKMGSEPGEELDPKAAELLSGARMSFTVHSKKALKDSGDKDIVGAAAKVSTPDGDLVEFRQVGDAAYVRTDIEALGKAVGEPMPKASDLPPEAGAFKKLLEGGWVTFDTKELEKAGEDASDEPSPEPSLDAKTQKKLTKAIQDVISREVDFAVADNGDGEEHIVATAPFRTLITELVDEIRPFKKELPPGVELPTAKDLKDAPNTKVAADFTLKNGDLTEVRIDLAKLAESAKVKKLGLVVRLSKGEQPTAPAGATKLDPTELLGAFGGPGMGQDASFGEEDLGEGGFSDEGASEVDPV
ncbi:hypothetical protein [Streptomyces lichenis]|uniref:Lipoprotein n=1 Tax=Streptomyces lichenis TaxID=2306967 RepID=A0ABT0I714_9ACTN|nr:hypothetical protein [Streptomyces lichenis]MCK8677120.1 hypothetical protein [Streptomyces lichenis]